MQDLFTAAYSRYPAPVPMWQAGSPYGYMYSMPYNPAMVPLQPQVILCSVSLSVCFYSVNLNEIVVLDLHVAANAILSSSFQISEPL